MEVRFMDEALDAIDGSVDMVSLLPINADRRRRRHHHRRAAATAAARRTALLAVRRR